MKKITAILITALLFITSSIPVFAINSNNKTKNEEIQKVVSGVLSNDTTIPFEEMADVMNEDENAAKQLINYFSEIAKPIPTENHWTDDDEQTDTERQYQYQSSTEYNPSTKQEKIVIENDLYLEPPIKYAEYEPGDTDLSSTPFSPFSSPLLTRSLDWTEENPQNYADTKTIFKLFIFKSGYNEVWNGTAFKVSANYLATAGHCLFDYYGDAFGAKATSADNKWAGNILCIPAYRVDSNGNEIYPLGSSYQVVTNMTCGTEWRQSGDWGRDWGVLQTKNDLHTGAMAFYYVGDRDDLSGTQVRLMGYPAGRKNMELSWGAITVSYRYSAIANCKGSGGQSGGPLNNTDTQIIGICSRGNESTGEVKFVKYDKWLFNKMLTYRNKS